MPAVPLREEMAKRIRMPEMPSPYRGRGLGQALRDLEPGQAIFVPCRDGETLNHLRDRVGGNLPRGGHLRIDRERNGFWLYKDGATP